MRVRQSRLKPDNSDRPATWDNAAVECWAPGALLPKLPYNPPIFASLRERTLCVDLKSEEDAFGAIDRKRLVMGRDFGLDMPATCAPPNTQRSNNNVRVPSMNLSGRGLSGHSI